MYYILSIRSLEKAERQFTNRAQVTPDNNELCILLQNCLWTNCLDITGNDFLHERDYVIFICLAVSVKFCITAVYSADLTSFLRHFIP